MRIRCNIVFWILISVSFLSACKSRHFGDKKATILNGPLTESDSPAQVSFDGLNDVVKYAPWFVLDFQRQLSKNAIHESLPSCFNGGLSESEIQSTRRRNFNFESLRYFLPILEKKVSDFYKKTVKEPVTVSYLNQKEGDFPCIAVVGQSLPWEQLTPQQHLKWVLDQVQWYIANKKIPYYSILRTTLEASFAFSRVYENTGKIILDPNNSRVNVKTVYQGSVDRLRQLTMTGGVIVPTIGALSPSRFVSLSTSPIKLLELTDLPEVEADGEVYFPHTFFDHDIGHALANLVGGSASLRGWSQFWIDAEPELQFSALLQDSLRYFRFLKFVKDEWRLSDGQLVQPGWKFERRGLLESLFVITHEFVLNKQGNTCSNALPLVFGEIQSVLFLCGHDRISFADFMQNRIRREAPELLNTEMRWQDFANAFDLLTAVPFKDLVYAAGDEKTKIWFSGRVDKLRILELKSQQKRDVQLYLDYTNDNSLQL